ncbi:hypothetical protein Nans01_38840 [Nocardiopsis ansamitocini]|uniref:HTH cro/C1-type domain-containing protein n=1 Tax=Nocardiopsis ansamitocini TaxID=1670832 RepID=A0A9W6UKF3_9ACTN|nr:hypothetical protein Nans01_38840 [Nocardiopsis ansamitocini]
MAHRRIELGLTRPQLAERAGMALGYIDYLEHNPPNLSRAALNRLADALHTSPDSLLGAGFEEPAGSASTRIPDPRLCSLDSQECMELIGKGGVGRIAFTVAGDTAPTVLPVNFLIAGNGVVFRTAAHGMIAEHAIGIDVCFETDRLDGATSEGWSVLITGRARAVRDTAELSALRATAPVRPWAAGKRDLLVMIVPTKITGRRVLGGHP